MTINSRHIRIGISAGEPAGIGPDLCIKLADSSYSNVQLVIVADPHILQVRAQQLGITINCKTFDPSDYQPAPKGTLIVAPIAKHAPVESGKLNPENSCYVLKALDFATDACIDGTFDALVTGPINKAVINDAGIAFSGHTEFLAEKTQCAKAVMMLAGKNLRIALATTHIPLSQVPQMITQDSLTECLEIIHKDLKKKFGFDNPKIAVCGLNPHAGDGGYLGKEEITVIEPVIKKLQIKGFNLTGPFSADTLFINPEADVILAMYHDQGLPAIKLKSFGNAVNITLGLPIIRTSVDHGTALELAGTNKVNPTSFFTSIDVAVQMIQNQSYW